MFAIEVKCSVPEAIIGLLLCESSLDLREGSGIPLQQLLLIVDGLGKEEEEEEEKEEEGADHDSIKPQMTDIGSMFCLLQIPS